MQSSHVVIIILISLQGSCSADQEEQRQKNRDIVDTQPQQSTPHEPKGLEHGSPQGEITSVESIGTGDLFGGAEPEITSVTADSADPEIEIVDDQSEDIVVENFEPLDVEEGIPFPDPTDSNDPEVQDSSPSPEANTEGILGGGSQEFYVSRSEHITASGRCLEASREVYDGLDQEEKTKFREELEGSCPAFLDDADLASLKLGRCHLEGRPNINFYRGTSPSESSKPLEVVQSEGQSECLNLGGVWSEAPIPDFLRNFVREGP